MLAWSSINCRMLVQALLAAAVLVVSTDALTDGARGYVHMYYVKHSLQRLLTLYSLMNVSK